MRSETDEFYVDFDTTSLHATSVGDVITVFANEQWNSGCVTLTKQQAREFARQLLEMCGEE